jgi:hypothetical protein
LRRLASSLSRAKATTITIITVITVNITGMIAAIMMTTVIELTKTL